MRIDEERQLLLSQYWKSYNYKANLRVIQYCNQFKEHQKSYCIIEVHQYIFRRR